MKTHTPDLSLQTLELMRMGTDARFPVQCKNYKVFLRPLTNQEIVEITNEVSQEISKMPQATQTRITEHTMYAKKVLEKASTDGPDSIVMGELTDYVLSRMTDRE